MNVFNLIMGNFQVRNYTTILSIIDLNEASANRIEFQLIFK